MRGEVCSVTLADQEDPRKEDPRKEDADVANIVRKKSIASVRNSPGQKCSL